MTETDTDARPPETPDEPGTRSEATAGSDSPPPREVARRVDPLGFIVQTLRVQAGRDANSMIDIDWAITPDGVPIGDPVRAETLYRMGIMPELAQPGDSIATVGFCAADQKWAGWSHRTIASFGVGDAVREGDSLALRPMSEWLADLRDGDPEPPAGTSVAYIGPDVMVGKFPVGHTARTLEDCRAMAVAYADEVG